MSYTALAVLGVALTLVLDLWLLRTRVVRRRLFWASYAIVVVFQLLTNGVLTGLRIVRYDGAAIIGDSTPVLLGHGRIAYAPVEDLLFGFALVVQTLAWWVFWGRRGVQRTPMAGPPRRWGSEARGVRRRDEPVRPGPTPAAPPRADGRQGPSPDG